MDRRTDVPSWKLSDDVNSFNKAETINNKNKSIVNLVLSQLKGIAGNSVPVPRYGKAVYSTYKIWPVLVRRLRPFMLSCCAIVSTVLMMMGDMGIGVKFLLVMIFLV